MRFDRNDSTTWNWTLSFTNSSANVSIFTNQSLGALDITLSGQRQFNYLAGDGGENVGVSYPLHSDTIELLTNGTLPVFRDWNSTSTKSATSGEAKNFHTKPSIQLLYFIVGLIILLAIV